MMSPSAAAPPGPSSAPLPSNYPTVAVSVIPTPPIPPLRSQHLPPLLTPSSPLRSIRRFRLRCPPCLYRPRSTSPPAPLSCVLTSRFSAVLLLLLAAIAVVYVASVAPRSSPSVPRFVPLPSLNLPPDPLPQPPPSLGILHPPAPLLPLPLSMSPPLLLLGLWL